MSPASIKAWFGQVTTGAGCMLLAPALLALLAHQITLPQALPALAAGLVGLIWPENKALAGAVQADAAQAVAAAPAVASGIETIIAAYRTGLQHGAAAAATPLPAPTGQAPH